MAKVGEVASSVMASRVSEIVVSGSLGLFKGDSSVLRRNRKTTFSIRLAAITGFLRVPSKSCPTSLRRGISPFLVAFTGGNLRVCLHLSVGIARIECIGAQGVYFLLYPDRHTAGVPMKHLGVVGLCLFAIGAIWVVQCRRHPTLLVGKYFETESPTVSSACNGHGECVLVDDGGSAYYFSVTDGLHAVRLRHPIAGTNLVSGWMSADGSAIILGSNNDFFEFKSGWKALRRLKIPPIHGEIVGVVFDSKVNILWCAINPYESADKRAYVIAVRPVSGAELGRFHLSERSSNVPMELDEEHHQLLVSPAGMSGTRMDSYLLTCRSGKVTGAVIPYAGEVAGAAFNGKSMVVGTESGEVIAMDPDTAAVNWNLAKPQAIPVSTILIKDKIAVVGHCGGNKFVGRGYVDVLDLDTGGVKQNIDVDGCVDTVAAMDSKVAIGMQDGRLIVAGAGGTQTYQVPVKKGSSGIEKIVTLPGHVLVVTGQQVFLFSRRQLR